ncbi:MAG: hypothetical protein JRJ29_22100 [Deltaproteobacteria bacterium]|nr:hypothetical protein [Deltaproteobacteria bacterium]
MPGANRYYIPGYVWHLTHGPRIHNGKMGKRMELLIGLGLTAIGIGAASIGNEAWRRAPRGFLVPL